MSNYSRVYIVNNEFHLFVVLTQYLNFHRPLGENISVIITKQPQSRRIETGRYNLPFNVIYLEDVFSNFKDVSKKTDYKSYILLNYEQVKELVIFHDSHFLNTLLVILFKECFKSKIILFQEGIAGYYQRKIYFAQYARYILKYIYFHFYKGYRISFVRSWGLSRNNDEIRMVFPNKVKERVKAPVYHLNLETTLEQIKFIHSLFNFDYNFYFKENEKVLLFLTMGNARRTRHLKLKELSVMKQLYELATQNGYRFVIKAKGNEDLLLYKENIPNGVTFITEPVNAELITFSLTNSIICSWFSSTNLYPVKSNNFFWLYPLIGLKDILKPAPDFISTINDLNHIFQNE